MDSIPLFVCDLAYYCGFFNWLFSKMSYFNCCFKGLIIHVNQFLHPGKRYSHVTKHSEFLRSNISFGFKERIKDTNKRCSLSWKIMQLQQMKSRESGSTKGSLNIGFITESLEFS